MSITGVEFIAGKTTMNQNSAVVLKFSVYQTSGGVPTSVLGSVNYTMPATQDTNLHLSYVNFGSPISVSNDYAIAVSLVNANTGYKMMTNDANYDATYDEKLLYLKWGTNSFATLNSIYQGVGANYDYEFIMHPIVSYTMSVNTLTATPSPSCTNKQVTFNATYTPTSAATNRFLNYDAFNAYFNVSNTNSTFLVAPLAPGDVTTIISGNPSNYTYTNTGSYTPVFQYTTGFLATCFDQKSVSLTINQTPDASFSYSTNSFCVTEANPTPTVVNSGGVFSSNSPNLAITATTGEIDLSNSLSGNYIVSYTYTNGSCTDVKTKNISISSNTVSSSFSYPNTTYCNNDGTANVALGSGSLSGVFSSTTGLVINSGSGVVDLLHSQPGGYTVTNAVAGVGACPGDTSTTSITVNANPQIAISQIAAACESDSVKTLVATPSGGVFSGVGVSNNTFNPSLGAIGVNKIYYNVTVNGCSSIDSANAWIDAVPTINFSLLDTVCSNASPITLNALPSGGAFSGDGVANGKFDPANAGIGNHVITYNVTTGACSASKSELINVDGCLGVEKMDKVQLNIYPNPTTNNLYIQTSEDATIQLYSLEGKEVLPAEKIEKNTMNTLHVSFLSQGIYLLKVRISNFEKVEKIIIE
jgi:hypothetical protein